MDTSGDSILMCKPNEVRRAREIAGSDLEPIHSCLFSGSDRNSGAQMELTRSLKRILLEVKSNLGSGIHTWALGCTPGLWDPRMGYGIYMWALGSMHGLWDLHMGSWGDTLKSG